MKLNNKYIIGTHIMFYEIDMVEEHIDSIVNAVKMIDNPKNVTVKLLLNRSEYFEKINFKKLTDKQLTDKYNNLISKLSHAGVTLDCNTYSVRKMWDDSWKPLEHPDFTDKPLLQRKNPDGSINKEAYEQPYSISYTMSIDEMNEINAKADEVEISMLTSPKFDGSGLIISSDLIKAGANIPLGIFGLSAEDTAFMYSCLQILGNNYRQFVIKNILKVHNRQHPKKRLYAIDMLEQQESTQELKGDWYNKLRDMNKQNLEIAFNNPQGKFLTYENFVKEL